MNIIRIVGSVSGVPSEYDGKYIVYYDPEYIHDTGYDGGLLCATDNKQEAQRFADILEARAYWMQQAPSPWETRPWDGKPNRPLTTFTVEILQEGKDR